MYCACKKSKRKPHPVFLSMVLGCFCSRRRANSDVKPISAAASPEPTEDSLSIDTPHGVLRGVGIVSDFKIAILKTRVSRDETYAIIPYPTSPAAKVAEPSGDQDMTETSAPYTPQEDLSTLSHAVHETHGKQNEEMTYIDDLGLVPTDLFNASASVPFFSGYASVMGYSSARLLHLRMSGIMIARESTPKHS